MSDPLPPPPGNLSPPPGYAAYQPSLMGAVPLHRTSGPSKALVVLLIVIAVLSALTAVLDRLLIDEVRSYLDGRLTESELTDKLSPFFAVTAVQFGLQIAAIVMTMIWMYRVADNHRRLDRRTTWGPGWAIAGWFLPPFVYVIPFLMLMEMWKASDPESPPSDQRWKDASVSPVVPIWWVLYGMILFSLRVFGGTAFIQMDQDVQDLAEQIDERQAAIFAGSLVEIAAAIAFLLVVRGITDRHSRLTGEANAR